MAIVVEEVEVETVDNRAAETTAPDTRQPPRVPDMDRIRYELRRESTRLERLWAD